MLYELLNTHDIVLWVDCDALVINFNQDLVDLFPEDKIQALVYHQIGETRAPTAGTWMVRKEMQPYLLKIWNMYQYTEHPWWEQAALQELMGYEQSPQYLTPLPIKVRDTELAGLTHELPYEWASYSFSDMAHQPNILHFPFGSVLDRMESMKKWIIEKQSYQTAWMNLLKTS